ncbi:MAG: M28 family metallopeptidase [Candidatus Bathyarchaeota archaeon]|nr:M28 family metallopeptidase [Candidatus Bathyarchaeota archaeon]
MFKQVFDKLEKEISGEIAYGYVESISQHHRIQASPGLSDAVRYAVETMKANGLDAHVDSYKADGKGFAWSSLMFKEWSCDDAELMLIEPTEQARFLARYTGSKMSVIQRSFPTGGWVEAEVVYVGKGEEPEDYKKKDVKGKMVLTDGDVSRVHRLAVEERGAKGIIYYGTWIREPELLEGELDDALKYTSYWWRGDEKPGYGFVLTPRTGRWLRDLCEKKTVKVKAKMESSIHEGVLDNAVAVIPGETNEQVIVVAHICHPQPSCNDNASGSAAAMEAARALQKLIEEGVLVKPKRSIVFTLVPEMSGTYAYLAKREKEIPSMVAAVNMDMVGEKQCVTSGSFIVESTPESHPSYVNSLIAAVFREVTREVKNLGGSDSYALFRHTLTPFSGGSDHYVYSDPTVGVPCPMLIQWPDKYWHTSYDTMDKVDPAMLKKAALVSATYAYFIATAGPAEATWIAAETHRMEKGVLVEKYGAYVQEACNTPESIPESIAKLRENAEFWNSVAIKAVESVKRLSGDELVTTSIEELTKDIHQTSKTQSRLARATLEQVLDASGVEARKYRKPRKKKLEQQADGIVPVRLYRGPWSTRYWEGKLSLVERDALRKLGKDHPGGRSAATLAMYWTDGKRSLYEVSEKVRLERGSTDLEFLMEYYGFLEKMGLVRLYR